MQVILKRFGQIRPMPTRSWAGLQNVRQAKHYFQPGIGRKKFAESNSDSLLSPKGAEAVGYLVEWEASKPDFIPQRSIAVAVSTE